MLRKRPHKEKPSQKRLKLPKNKKIPGLYLFCNTCKEWYSDDTEIACMHKNLVYKAKIHVPKEFSEKRNECRTKNFEAENYKEVVRKFMSYLEELESNSFASSSRGARPQNFPISPEPVNIGPPTLLIDCMAEYMAYLNNVGVEEYEIKHRGEKGKHDMETRLRYYIEAIEGEEIIDGTGRKIKINTATLRFTDVNKAIVSLVYKFVKAKRTKKGTPLANKSFNNIFADIKTFTSHIIRRHSLTYSNPFLVVKKKKVFPKKVSVRPEEFKELLNVISYENGFKDVKNKKGDNVWRPWTKDAFLLGLFTGGRNDEVVELQWSGIKLDEDDKLAILEVNHFKRNRADGNLVSETEYRIKQFAIHPELEKLLYDLGYEENKNSDKYILAPDETVSRGQIKVLMSAAFPHFFNQLNTGVKKNFKHLRKSYATQANKAMGSQAHIVTDHESMEIMNNHYIDDEEILKVASKRMRFLDQ